MARNKAGVSFEGAQIAQQQQQARDEELATQRFIAEQQRQTHERHLADQRRTAEDRSHRQDNGGSSGNGGGNGGRGNRGNGTGGGNDDGGNDGLGNGDGSGRLPRTFYMPGRLSSQFDFRADPNKKPFQPSDHHFQSEETAKDYNYGRAVEFSSSKNGNAISVTKAGPEGGVWVMRSRRPDGEFADDRHTTVHIAGNQHFHPDEQDRTKNYYVKPKDWFAKDSLLAQIIDKGPRARFKKPKSRF